MPEAKSSRDEALKRFDARYDALAKANRRKPPAVGMESGAGAGYRAIGELIGGALSGLGLGWCVDRLTGAQPLGLICGLLIGMGVGVYLIVRSAGHVSGATTARIEQPDAKAPEQDDGVG